MKPGPRRLLSVVAILCGLIVLILAAVLRIPPAGFDPVAGVRNADLHQLPGRDDEPWSIAVISDIQNGHAYLPELFRRLSDPPPRAIVVTGDLAPDPSPELAQLPVWYLRRWPPPAPMFVVPGNHDLALIPGGRLGEPEFLGWYGALTFEFRIGRTVFIGLDNSTSPIVGPALEDLRRRLEAAKDRGDRAILCLHRNIVQFEEPDPISPLDERVRELIRDYDVPYVLCGHLHHDAYDGQGGTQYVAVPASGHRPANDPGQKPVAFMRLNWDGTRFELRREEFYRGNWTELKGVTLYLALAKIHPCLVRFPRTSGLIAGVCLFVAVAGTGILWRSRRGDPC
jgi:hypothetical protein